MYGYSNAVQWLCFRLGFVWDWSGKHLPSECVLLLLCRWSDVFLLIVCGEMCSIVKCCLLNRAAGSAVAHSVQTNDYLMASATKDIEAHRLEKEAWKRLGPFCMAVFRLCHFIGTLVNKLCVIMTDSVSVAGTSSKPFSIYN